MSQYIKSICREVKILVWLLVIFGIIILVVFLYNLPINVKLQFTYKQNNIYLMAKCFNKYIIKKNISFKDRQQQSSEKENILEILNQLPSEISNTFQALHSNKENIAPYLRAMQIDSFMWRSVLGLGKPNVTSLMFGSLWTVKGILTGWFAQQVKGFPKPDLFVIPEFVDQKFETKLVCIGSIRLGKAMYTLMKVKTNKNDKKIV